MKKSVIRHFPQPLPILIHHSNEVSLCVPLMPPLVIPAKAGIQIG